MKITKCDICGITSEDESKPYINDYQCAIFKEFSKEVVFYDKIDICEEYKKKLKKKSGNVDCIFRIRDSNINKNCCMLEPIIFSSLTGASIIKFEKCQCEEIGCPKLSGVG